MVSFPSFLNLPCVYGQLHCYGEASDAPPLLETTWPKDSFLEPPFAQRVQPFQKNVIVFSHCQYLADIFFLEEIGQLKRWFKEKYGVSIESIAQVKTVQGGDSVYTLYPSPLSKQFEQLKQLKQQLIKISPEFFLRYGLKTFVLCGQIDERSLNGNVIRGYRAAIPPGSEEAYFVEAWPFYHEFFHKMDYQQGGMPLMGAMTFQEYKAASRDNEEWVKLNPKDKIRGDVVDEEQAEFARILFNLDDPTIRKNQYQPILSNPGKLAKLSKMKEWLYKWSQGKLNNQYWHDLEMGKVNESYWPSLNK